MAKWSNHYSEILKVLSQNKTTTYKEISQTVFTPPSNLKKLVATLQKKGLVDLSTEGNPVQIELSNKGVKMVESLIEFS